MRGTARAPRPPSARHKPITVGRWPCPSGNALTVVLVERERGTPTSVVRLDWADPAPPAAQRRNDMTYFLTTLSLEIVRALNEWAEQPVPAEIALHAPVAVVVVYRADGAVVIEPAADAHVELPGHAHWLCPSTQPFDVVNR